jgi:putative transposase
MRVMGIRPLCPLPSLSGPAAHRPGFPYLLAAKETSFPNQVRSTDITYVQIGGRHTCLTAVIDWYSRYIVAWRLSDTMRACEVVACSEAGYASHGIPPRPAGDLDHRPLPLGHVHVLP